MDSKHTDDGAPTYPVVVRFTEAARLDFAHKARRINKVRSLGTFVLAIMVIPVVAILPGLVMWTMSTVASESAWAAGLMAAGLLGSGLLLWQEYVLDKRRPELPEVAVTITEDAVSFGGIPRLTPFQPRLDAVSWPRSETHVEVTAPTSWLPALVAFRRAGESKRRVRSFPIASIDTDAATIVAAAEFGIESGTEGTKLQP